MTGPRGREARILLVEDDEVDVMIARRALRKAGLEPRLVVARDGLEALNLLRGEAAGAPLQRPYLILLDINMPRMNGLELLAELRADDRLQSALVFVWTTSEDPRDIDAAYLHNIAGYLVKSDHARSVEVAEMLSRYLDVVRLPGG